MTDSRARTPGTEEELPPVVAASDDSQIVKALLEGAYVSQENLEKAQEYAATHRTSPIEYLLSEELVTKDLIGQAMAESFGVPYFDLNSNMPSEEVIRRMSQELSVKLHAVHVEGQDGKHVVVTDHPENPKLMSELGIAFPGERTMIAYSLPEDIEEAMHAYRTKLVTRFTEILKKEHHVAPEIVLQIIEDALTLRASDIHIEPQEDEIIIRFRIDGLLQEAGRLPKHYHENILNRLKLEANLRTDEHQKSQDGAIRFKGEAGSADIRVSILPTLTGEKAVLRMLSSYLRSLSLATLGLSEEQQARITEIASRPYGMILTVGPTGSGKTTTLYGVLKFLNDVSENITTIEDPVEYRIPHVNQVQVNEAGGMTFARGLRSIVRQDPDVILVGEIRDLETAEIAVNASLTGHLLLSTFHANDAATVIPRLLDMKVEPFMLASTLMMVIAQRLVRTICPSCKTSDETTGEAVITQYPKLAPFFNKGPLRLYKGKGCTVCNGTGFRGQIGIFELIEISPRIQTLIMENPSADRIAELTHKEGGSSLFEDGLRKVLDGYTTIDELLRIAVPPRTALEAHE